MERFPALAVAFLLLGVSSFAQRGGADHVNPGDIVDVLPRDAIPAILAPSFGADSRAWLPEDWAVIGVDIGSDARAYPITILNWHEIVNDLVGGVPLALTFCPLCGTGIAFDRTVGSDVLTFGVSGKLYKNDLVMNDHQTGSYWTQLLGEGIAGPNHGTRLRVLSSTTMAWGEWRDLHPDTLLLDRPTDAFGAFLRDYSYNPYEGYDSSTAIYFKQGNVDPSRVLHPKELVLGVYLNGGARAYPISILRNDPVVNDVLGGTPLLVTHASGVMKAWERGDRTFVASGDADVADDLGRTYSRITGIGPDDALRELPATTAFWFAWFDFFPATSIYRIEDLPPRAESSVNGILLAVGAVGAAGAAAYLLARKRRNSSARAGTGGRGDTTKGRE